jgi:hypothetical protein
MQTSMDTRGMIFHKNPLEVGLRKVCMLTCGGELSCMFEKKRSWYRRDLAINYDGFITVRD